VSPASVSDKAFQAAVVDWAACNGRHFPWRDTTDPYRILMAEMMLRRTRAAQVVPTYERFIAVYPSFLSLAKGSEWEVREILRPLGLGWRVPAFREIALRVVENHKGNLPCDRGALLALPGIGPYVADAVLAFACDMPVALVDTNTVRVAGRYLGIPVGPESRRCLHVQEAVGNLIDPKRARVANLAVIDFAAEICRPGRPRCDECPASKWCVYATQAEAVNQK
jgi:A/G-specific adenine glycosylase